MFEIKSISQESIPRALEKAEQYRLLNESWQAKSICEEAEGLRTPGNDDAVLRRNTCVRMLLRNRNLAPTEERAEVLAMME